MRTQQVRSKVQMGNSVAQLGWSLALAIVLPALSCSHTYALVPASTETVAPGPGPAVAAENNGVHMVVNTQAWTGNPPRLTDFVLPVWVEIENHSGKTIWVRYTDFQIVSGANPSTTLHVVPPFKVKGTAVVASEPVYQPPQGWAGFAPAPYLGPSYSGLEPWTDEYPMDMSYYSSYSTTWQESLPTNDMLTKALPEGALKDGGRVTGFLYFQRLKEDLGAAALQATFEDAATKQPTARVEVHYTVAKI